MIFLLIAGSYTPFCLIALEGTTGWVLFSIIITIAIVGISFKLIWFNCPRWLSTSIYVIMGWIAVFLMGPLKESLSSQGLSLLIIGGVFHEIFHIFIMFGTLTHFLCVFKYVI